ncbi:heavy metal translocating P-type ATPase [Rudaeicoccus suwonensis]|uniref:P-type E1-E2 ATPase/heavy metal translocating P-type ATPase n=1 Tax=Rudaeicoccus suwonensis TaxID=657409 RepID=A0A561EB40_9MICO|nr:heavy metal translocating P-type ATPase [Rudaeicoccus suwonensis]TWE12819.1 P-type E1-E2 ATPase/heavy metal translocating P-type ATPase [Rudaeicoccus suwonensis]
MFEYLFKYSHSGCADDTDEEQMSTVIPDDRTSHRADTASPVRKTRLMALTEVRWAAAALLLFLVALPLQLASAPAWIWLVLYAAVYGCGGWEPGWAGLRALGERTLDVDLLMVVAAIGAAAIGQVVDGALLIVIFATSGALEALATARTQDSVRGLLDLAPATATRIDDDGHESVALTDDLRIGDEVLVRPGELLAADGHVVRGASDVDQMSITGEPLPATKSIGDEVFAGTMNGSGTLRIRVSRDPHEWVIARIVDMVQEASETKAPTQLFIEKVEQRYSIGMVTVTLAVFVVPLLLGEHLAAALLRAMTFMIVASPCAVVLATMPPLLSAIATAGRNGVLVKSAVVMEQLGRIDTVAVDKTGTLTEGAPVVTHVEAIDPAHSPDQLLSWAGAVEQGSEHPLAAAILAEARARKVVLPSADDFASTPGAGVSAVVSGVRTAVLSPVRSREQLTPDAGRRVQTLEADGHTVVVLLRGDQPVGLFALADRLRDRSRAAMADLASLTASGPLLLTGDNAAAATHVGAQVGITDIRAGLLPQDKVSAIRVEQAAGRRVLVVGDGVNDAPALAAADVGVAMGGAGADLTLDTADAVVVRDDLLTVPAAVRLSRRAHRIVRQNLLIAGAFITVLVAWDLIGSLPLPLGVLGHEGSTVVVGLNGLRLLRRDAWETGTTIADGMPSS